MRSYDPQFEEKEHDAWIAKTQMRDNGILKPLTGILRASLWVDIPYPQSMPQKRRMGQYCEKRPDLDNYAKYYFDVLNGIAYADDAQIVYLITEKRYSENPGVRIEIHEINV